MDFVVPPLFAPEVPPNLGEESVIIDCTKSNFIEQSNDFIKRVGKASFIAIDEEMTGIQLPPSRGHSDLLVKDASPADRYAGTKRVSERYSIIQLGICLFEEDNEAPGNIHVRRYKFTMFPPEDSKITREVVLSPSSVKFLVGDNNCNLNEWIKEGVPFCTGEVAERLLTKYRKEEEEKEAKESEPTSIPSFNDRNRVQLRRLEDQQFHSRAMSTLREWLDAPSEPSAEDPEGTSLLLPSCNSFLRRALYESISHEYGSLLVLETLRESSQIKVWRLTSAERKHRNARLRREGFERILMEKIGTWRVFLALHLACSGRSVQTRAEHMALAMDVDEAMVDWEPSQSVNNSRKIPLIVHNGLQDLLFLMTHFNNEILPDTWPECKAMIHSYFPMIYDTKLMATEYCSRDTVRGRTHLGALYELALLTDPRWNRVFTSTNGSAELQDQLHDAGFDAYCTGVAFYGVATLVHRQCQFPSLPESPKFALWNCEPSDADIAWHYGRNKLYFHLSPYTIDFEALAYDPLAKGMSRSSMYRVDGIDSSVTTRDIVHSLSGLTDSMEQSVSYELIWINDVRFLVGAMNLNREAGPHQEHGKLIFQAMKNRFPNAKVGPFAIFDTADVPEPSIWNLWGFLSGGKKRATSNDDFARITKRRRLE